jgi:hypothetical protein
MSPRPRKVHITIHHRRGQACPRAEAVLWEDGRQPVGYWCVACFPAPRSARPYYLSTHAHIVLDHDATTAAPAQKENAA